MDVRVQDELKTTYSVLHELKVTCSQWQTALDRYWIRDSWNMTQYISIHALMSSRQYNEA